MPTLLVIEDDRLAHEQLLKKLRSWGHTQLLSAYSSDEAAAICLHKNPDLLLVDIELPGRYRDGVELVEKLRERGDDVAVIYLSGVSNKELLQRAQQTSPASILSKLMLDAYLEVNISNALGNGQQSSLSNGSSPLRIFIRTRNGNHIPILLEDIVYIESGDNTSCLYLADGRKPCLSKPFKRFLADLPHGHPMLRVHRSWAVNILKIEHVNRNDRSIKLHHHRGLVPIGDTFYHSVLESLGL